MFFLFLSFLHFVASDEVLFDSALCLDNLTAVNLLPFDNNAFSVLDEGEFEIEGELQCASITREGELPLLVDDNPANLSLSLDPSLVSDSFLVVLKLKIDGEVELIQDVPPFFSFVLENEVESQFIELSVVNEALIIENSIGTRQVTFLDNREFEDGFLFASFLIDKRIRANDRLTFENDFCTFPEDTTGGGISCFNSLAFVPFELSDASLEVTITQSVNSGRLNLAQMVFFKNIDEILELEVSLSRARALPDFIPDTLRFTDTPTASPIGDNDDADNSENNNDGLAIGLGVFGALLVVGVLVSLLAYKVLVKKKNETYALTNHV